MLILTKGIVMAITNHAQFAVELHRRYLKTPRTYAEATHREGYADWIYPHEEEQNSSELVICAVILVVLSVGIGYLIGRFI